MTSELHEEQSKHEQMMLLMDTVLYGNKIHGREWSSNVYTCPCGKDVYLSYSAAMNALRQRGRRGDRKLIYKCSICGHYHCFSKGNMFHRKPKAYDRRKADMEGKSDIKQYMNTRDRFEPIPASNKRLLVKTNNISNIEYQVILTKAGGLNPRFRS